MKYPQRKKKKNNEKNKTEARRIRSGGKKRIEDDGHRDSTKIFLYIMKKNKKKTYSEICIAVTKGMRKRDLEGKPELSVSGRKEVGINKSRVQSIFL